MPRFGINTFIDRLRTVIKSGGSSQEKDYRILVNTANTGTSNNDQFQFTGALGDYSVEVYNSAGTTLLETITGLSGSATITIAAGAGSYELRVIPAAVNGFNRIQFINGGDKLKLIEVRNWGTVAWSTMSLAYFGCANLDVVSTDVPDLSGVTSMLRTFQGCTVLNGPANIGDWNTGAVTTMAGMFNSAVAFNQLIGAWNTAAVTTMQEMFRLAMAFNQPIGDWNTGAVTDMSFMFNVATAFNQPIGNWNTEAVTTMLSMFQEASAFNQSIGDWNTGAVTNMSQMFRLASAFNQPIGDWNSGAVTNMSSMFRQASAFNQPLDSLNVAAVTNFTDFMLFKTAANYTAANLDAIYQDWTDQQLTPALSISFGTIKRTSAGTAGRNLLTRANATVAVTGAVANAGEVQITAVAHGLSTGDKVLIYDVGGTTEANGGWIITVDDADSFTLDGSAFVNTYTSGGTARTGFGWTVDGGGI